jgi:hypothetical protein
MTSLVDRASQGTKALHGKRPILTASPSASYQNNNSHPPVGASTPPRMVTPDKKSSPDFLHKPTATNGVVDYQSPYKPTDPSLRYSLSRGVEPEAPGSYSATTTGRSQSHSHHHQPPSKKVEEAFPRPAKEDSGARLPSSSRSGNLTTTRSSSTSSKLRKYDPSSYKIFLLLLQPAKKTFELIQLVYSPNDTTVGDIISMIPANATEPVLGNQTYTGLCRPKTQQEIVDHDLLASESRPGVVSAKITLGEILVAIPEGYTGSDVSVLAKQILSNPKIVKLLKRADPLAPKKSRRSTGRSSRSSGRHSSHRRQVHRSKSKEHVEVMEKFDEADEIAQEQQRKIQAAMEHAAQEAAAANAAIPGGSTDSTAGTNATGVKLTRSMSITSNGTDEKSLESSLQESLDESYSSWSKSFDASFASSVCSGVTKRAIRRREREVRRTRILKRSLAVVFVMMVAFYLLDPRGYSSPDKQSNEEVTQNPMGLSGLFQSIFLLLAIYKTERLIRRSSNPDEAKSDGKSRCPFLKAAATTMRKFKSRYAKKLKRKQSTAAFIQGRIGDDDLSLTHKLRSFSLKASAMPPPNEY